MGAQVGRCSVPGRLRVGDAVTLDSLRVLDAGACLPAGVQDVIHRIIPYEGLILRRLPLSAGSPHSDRPCSRALQANRERRPLVWGRLSCRSAADHRPDSRSWWDEGGRTGRRQAGSPRRRHRGGCRGRGHSCSCDRCPSSGRGGRRVQKGACGGVATVAAHLQFIFFPILPAMYPHLPPASLQWGGAPSASTNPPLAAHSTKLIQAH